MRTIEFLAAHSTPELLAFALDSEPAPASAPVAATDEVGVENNANVSEPDGAGTAEEGTATETEDAADEAAGASSDVDEALLDSGIVYCRTEDVVAFLQENGLIGAPEPAAQEAPRVFSSARPDAPPMIPTAAPAAEAPDTDDATATNPSPISNADTPPRPKIRPIEVQKLIRGGMSIAEVAEKLGVRESRLESLARPVLLERELIVAEARSATPLLDGHPQRLNLWESLAVAFAHRDIDLAASTWDSYRNPAGQWVVRVGWTTNHGQDHAEWYLDRGSRPQVKPKDRLSADLINPDLAAPVRVMSTQEFLNSVEETRDDIPPVTDAPLEQAGTGEPPADAGGSNASGTGATGANAGSTASGKPAVKPGEVTDELVGTEADFLQNPAPQQQQKRKRSATPAWEDVLLGVRTNNRRPKD